MKEAQWISDVEASLSVAEAADYVGLTVRGRNLGPCPSCNKARGRGRSDRKRLPVHFGPDTHTGVDGWKCEDCQATGDALGLVALTLGKGPIRGMPKESRDEVQAFLAQYGKCKEPWVPKGARAPIPPRIRRAVEDPEPDPDPITSAEWPAQDEVLRVWERGVPVCQDSEVAEAVANRLGPEGPGVVDLFGVARALPCNITLPRWAWMGRQDWNAWGFRLLCPLYDEHGQIRSLRAWRVRPMPAEMKAPKSLGPTGFALRGLVLACDKGRYLLGHGRPWPGWPEHRRLQVVISEGEPDWLSWLVRRIHVARPPAAFGVAEGMWSPLMAAKVPDGAVVSVWTHHGDAKGTGDKMATKIFAAFGDRDVVLLRAGGG